tara:strand:- start:1479 stop:1757 length:279 start_codon:yes stop_codon:yes gene_type:complete
MSLSDKTNLLIKPYRRQALPVINENLGTYLIEELRRIEASIESLNTAAIQVADVSPENPIKGMVRYNVSPWDALGNGTYGMVVYNGTSWVAV